MLDVIVDSHGAPPVLRDRAEVLLAELAGPSGRVGFPVAGVRKDLEAVVSTAVDSGVPAAAAAAALATFTSATGAGYADRDLASVAAYLVQLSRTTVPSPDLAAHLGRGS